MDDIRDLVTAHFDSRSERYDESVMHRDLAAAVAQFAADLPVATAPHVLDVATGTGLVLRSLATLPPFARATLTGVDLSEGMLAVAREHLPAADLRRADAAALPLADASVDLVTCVTALHLFTDPAGALTEWARVLRGDGRVVTATFAVRGDGHGTEQGREHGHGRPRPFPTDHASFATPDRLAAAAAPAGLTLGRTTTWTDGTDTVLIAELTRTWRTDRLLGEPFQETALGPATLVRYAPGDVVHPGDRPASGSGGDLVEVPAGAGPEQLRRALDQHGYYLQRVRPSWRVRVRPGNAIR